MGEAGLFGNLSKDIGRHRLLRVGIGCGIILGAVASKGPEWLHWFALFVGAVSIIISSAAQFFWPDREAGDD